MTILTSIILVLSIVAVATFIGYYVQRGQPTMDELWEDPNKQQDIIENTPQIENIEVVSPQDIEKVVKLSKIIPENAALNEETIIKSPKNKKGHYYSRKPKTVI